jgi:hypothetical protein
MQLPKPLWLLTDLKSPKLLANPCLYSLSRRHIIIHRRKHRPSVHHRVVLNSNLPHRCYRNVPRQPQKLTSSQDLCFHHLVCDQFPAVGMTPSRIAERAA